MYTLWEDSVPYGYLLDAVLECSDLNNDNDDNDDNPLASQIGCNGDELEITFYDSCETKDCQFVGIPINNSTTSNNSSSHGNSLCFFVGTIDSCSDGGLSLKIRPCGGGDDDTLIGGGKFDHIQQRLNSLAREIKRRLERLLFLK
jgi:hypothetical protein